MDQVFFWVEMLLLGLGVGVISAALGVGGGILMVPAFVTFVDGMDTNTAKGTSLFIIVFVSSYNAFRMNRGAMKTPWTAVIAISVGSIVGGYAGGWATGLMPDKVVTWVFVALLGFSAARTFMLKEYNVSEDEVRTRNGASGAIGFLTGIVSGATGTGGGSVLVPLSLWAGIVSNARVVAMSNTVMISTCTAAALAHFFAEKSALGMAYTYGLVNVSLAPVVFVGAVLSAPLGRKINAMLTLERRRVVMGAILAIIAVRLAWRAMQLS